MKDIFIRPFLCLRDKADPIRRGLRQAICALAVLAAVAQPGSAQQGAYSRLGQPVSSSTLRKDDLRVGEVAYRLALRGARLCSEAYPLTGLLFHHLAEYRAGDRPLMVQRYRLDRGPGVLSVVGGSPSAEAGLEAGDVLLSVNSRAFATGAAIAAEPKRERWRRQVEDSEGQLEQALRSGPARLRVLRSGRETEVTLGSAPGCYGRIRLARSTQVNAFATGRTVVMTTAMLAFLKSDDELAVVLGHELAHDILHHPATRTEDGVLASVGIKAREIWKREEAADRLGLRLVAEAGYDLDAAIPFWRRYLKKYDWFPQIFRSHPSLSARERIAAEEIAAIRRERAGL
jgi:hypothetical protein